MYSELDLVNHLLTTLGESTTPTLDTQHPAVLQARDTLLNYNKEFQGRGWWFNEEFSLKLLPDTDGRILVPDSCLSFKVTRCVIGTMSAMNRSRFVKRGRYIYDTVNHTNVIGFPIWTDLVVLLDYEDLPQTAGSFLKHWAAESAFLADDGDLQVWRALAMKTEKAEQALKADMLKTIKVNALQSPGAQRLLMGTRGTTGATSEARFVGG